LLPVSRGQLSCWLWPAIPLVTLTSQAASSQPSLRVATVSDSIEMTRLENPASQLAPAAIVSPDGSKFLIVTYRGRLSRNDNEATLLLFRQRGTTVTRRPEVLLRWASESNDSAISDAQWRDDNKTIFFLGTRQHQQPQLYCLDSLTHKWQQVTHHPTGVLRFTATVDGRMLVYLARPVVSTVRGSQSTANGVLVSNQTLVDLMTGRTSDSTWEHPAELFVQRASQPAMRIRFASRESPVWEEQLNLSPDGKFLVLTSDTRWYPSPGSWKQYRLPYGDNQVSFFVHILVDTRTGATRRLVDAPIYCWGGCIAWSGDSKSVVVGGSYLPLDSADPGRRDVLAKTPFVVEVNAQTGEVAEITAGSARIVNWNATDNTIHLQPFTDNYFTARQPGAKFAVYRKIEGKWQAQESTGTDRSGRELEIQVTEDLNTPPQLVARNGHTGKRSLLMDLNPQFKTLQFGHVEEFLWTSSDGVSYRGGLYLPPYYRQGQKYPLVIQTHGWNPDEFSIDGGYTAGYAAQALAGREIVVAQVPLAAELSTPQEGPNNMAMYEGAIDELDRRGLIRRDKVGLLGFSRTGQHVRYALAFSRYPIAAAVIADGVNDGGYWQYVAEFNREPEWVGRAFEGQNGGAPYGEGLKSWLKNSPDFNLDKVHTPIRQLGFGPHWFEYNWEPFAGLKRLREPVEMIWLPEAAHLPVKPLERMAAQQGDVDWFCFWLKAEEDPDPKKADQYRRWRALRQLQEAHSAAPSSATGLPLAPVVSTDSPESR
jgi:dipeptidyl aminopeptidase/acylaminoacyl peptidase